MWNKDEGGALLGNERLSLVSVDSQRLKELARTTTAMMKEVCLSERKQQRARQLAANADVRRRWTDADSMTLGKVEWQSPPSGFSDNGSRSKIRFRALIAVFGTTGVRNALAQMVSVFWHSTHGTQTDEQVTVEATVTRSTPNSSSLSR